VSSSSRMADGSWDWSFGVDSGKVTTIASNLMPNGLKRNQLAWLTNATVRGGGITQRTGWKPLTTVTTGAALYQGGILYENSLQAGNPYLLLSISGILYQVRVDTDNSVHDVSTLPGLNDPPDAPQAFFVQGEEFAVKQAGDGVTLPLFWDGNALRRSAGLPGGELPAATCMDYFMGRIWYAQGRQYTAGDIVLGPSGTAPYSLRDAILKVTENPLALAGDGFIVPTQDGIIRALHHSANMDTSLGEGQLFTFTRKAIYSLTVPVKRADWILSTEPLQKVVQNKNGSYGDRGIVNANGDLFYQSSDGIRSLFVSQRSFSEWSNLPISSNINRLLNFNNREFMRFSSGIYWDNRLYQTALPEMTDVGVAFKGIAVLDFDLISSLQEKSPPAWEGMLNGEDILQLFSGDFGGRDRAFAVVRSRVDGSIQVWELDASTRHDNTDSRVEWFFETPAWTFGKEFELKRLDGLEIWLDRIYGTVELTVEYRPDGATCWNFWNRTKFCSARTTCENVVENICYPQEGYAVQGEGDKFSLNFPTPPAPDCQTLNNRPTNLGFQFQLRVTIKGWCRVRGVMVFAIPVQKAPFDRMECS